jgi:hypothetical protein
MRNNMTGNETRQLSLKLEASDTVTDEYYSSQELMEIQMLVSHITTPPMKVFRTLADLDVFPLAYNALTLPKEELPLHMHTLFRSVNKIVKWRLEHDK